MDQRDEQRVAEFSRLLVENRSRIFGFIYSILHNVADAEDVYQQTTIILWTKFEEFRPGSSFVNWALAVAQIKVKQFCSSAARDRNKLWFDDQLVSLMAESFGDSGPSLSVSDRMDGLLYCLEKLPEKQRQILRLRYADGLRICELARRESKTTAAMTMVLARLRKSLLTCIKASIAKGQTDVR